MIAVLILMGFVIAALTTLTFLQAGDVKHWRTQTIAAREKAAKLRKQVDEYKDANQRWAQCFADLQQTQRLPGWGEFLEPAADLPAETVHSVITGFEQLLQQEGGDR